MLSKPFAETHPLPHLWRPALSSCLNGTHPDCRYLCPGTSDYCTPPGTPDFRTPHPVPLLVTSGCGAASTVDDEPRGVVDRHGHRPRPTDRWTVNGTYRRGGEGAGQVRSALAVGQVDSGRKGSGGQGNGIAQIKIQDSSDWMGWIGLSQVEKFYVMLGLEQRDYSSVECH